MTNLLQASNQWNTRPADERFWTLEEMHAAAQHFQDCSAESTDVDLSALSVGVSGHNLTLTGEAGVPATITHHAFGQIAQRIKAPARYLRSLSPELAALNVEEGLQRMDAEDKKASVLFHRNGGFYARAFTSERYSRIWNADVVAKAILLQDGWRVPPAWGTWSPIEGLPTRAATVQDCMRTSLVKPGDTITPSGLYLSNHDSFIFMVNDDARINDGSDNGLARGFFISNSEVGAGALKLVLFLYEYVCGNHIVWNASNVTEVRVIHIGNANANGLLKVRAQLKEWADSGATETEAEIKRLQTVEIAATKDEVLDAIFPVVRSRVSRTVLSQAYDRAESRDIYSNPRTRWGLSQGLTEISQGLFTDERVSLDRAAGEILAAA